MPSHTRLSLERDQKRHGATHLSRAGSFLRTDNRQNAEAASENNSLFTNFPTDYYDPSSGGSRKNGVYKWSHNKFIDFLVRWVGTRSSLGRQQVCGWVMGKCLFYKRGEGVFVFGRPSSNDGSPVPVQCVR